MPRIFKIALLTFSLGLVVFAFCGVDMHTVRAQEGAASAYRQMNVYSEVLQRVQSDYVVQPDINAATTGALRGLLESLDSDSSYLTPADYAVYKAGPTGTAQVGLNVGKRYGYAVVVSVVPGSPADKAQMEDGDILESIGTTSTRDVPAAMVPLMLEGKAGTQVALSVIRPQRATPEKLTLTRTEVSYGVNGESGFENNSILQLKPPVIDKAHVAQIEQKLRALPKSGYGKVILDLRDVAGNDMNDGVRLANFFLAKGTIATLEGQKIAKQTFAADPALAVNTSIPLAVLVNRGTAGAAEIVAAAIADNKRGDVVGEKTFGTAVQQKTIELPDGAALVLSIGKYETPAGKVIEDTGVTPTVLVAANDETPVVDEDEDAAPEPAATPAAKPVKMEAPKMDETLTKALDLLKQK